MGLDDCYRLLEIDPAVSDEELKRAHRDLTKVWHPDRFQHDPSMQARAQEKLKAINEAYETIRSARQGSSRWRRPAPDRDDRGEDSGGWRVRSGGSEMSVADLEEVIDLAKRGYVGEDADVFNPATARWTPAAEIPELRGAFTQRRLRRYRSYAFAAAGVGLLILVRRPTPGGLILALILFAIAFFLIVAKMRKTS